MSYYSQICHKIYLCLSKNLSLKVKIAHPKVVFFSVDRSVLPVSSFLFPRMHAQLRFDCNDLSLLAYVHDVQSHMYLKLLNTK